MDKCTQDALVAALRALVQLQILANDTATRQAQALERIASVLERPAIFSWGQLSSAGESSLNDKKD